MGKKTSKTLIIPTLTINEELLLMTIRCIESYQNQADCIIVMEDGGLYSKSLQTLANIYIYGKENVGFTKNVNRGWNLSHTDFTFIVNSDTYLIDGKLEDLCRENQVVCPSIVNLDNYPGFTGSFWVVPKDIKEKYGLLDERFKNYESDLEYYERIKHLFHKNLDVKIYHTKGQTVKVAGFNVQEEQQKDALKW